MMSRKRAELTGVLMATLLGSAALTGCASGIAAKGPESVPMAAQAPAQAAPAASVAAPAAAPLLSSYMAIVDKESFAASVVPMKIAKPEIAQRHPALLAKRYNLSNRAAPTGAKRATMSPASISAGGLWPRRFFSLPLALHPEDAKHQMGLDLAHFDLDFELPNHLVAEFSPLIYLTPRPDLEDTMLSLQIERFYKPQMSQGMAPADGRIKSLPRLGFTGDPKYLKDGRLLSMEDTVELFTQAVGLKLSAQNKGHLATFLKSL